MNARLKSVAFSNVLLARNPFTDMDCYSMYFVFILILYTGKSLTAISRRHSNTHSKPYSCGSCSKAFALRNDRDRHKIIHNPVFAYLYCPLNTSCFKGTKRRDSLRRHLRDKHTQNGLKLSKEQIAVLIKEAVSEQECLMNYSSLLSVVQIGNDLIVKRFIDNGANVAEKSDNGKTALHIAAVRGSIGIIQLLLEAGANAEATDGEGNTALHDAALSGTVPAVKWFTDRGYHVDCQNKDGYTPLHFSALKGHVTVTRLLLKGCSDVNSEACNGEIPLHLAAAGGHEEVVHLLLTRGARVEIATDDRRNALYFALKTGNEAIMRSLCCHVVKTSLYAEPQATGLRTAAGEVHEGIQRLLQGRNLDINRAFLEATARGDSAFVGLLLEIGADVNADPRQKGGALHQAACKGYNTVVKLLLGYGADVHKKDWKSGLTALHEAASKGFDLVVKLLLEHGAKVDIDTGQEGSALELAVSNGHITVVKLLLDHGAEVTQKTSWKEGVSVLHAAVASGDHAVVKLLLSHRRRVNFGLELEMCALEAALKGHDTILSILFNYAIDACMPTGCEKIALEWQMYEACKRHYVFQASLQERGTCNIFRSRITAGEKYAITPRYLKDIKETY